MKLVHFAKEYATLVLIWIGLIGVFSLAGSNFLSTATFTTLAGRVPTLAVLATGMTLVLVIGGIDLSVGSMLGLSTAVLGVTLGDVHWPLWLGMVSAVATGTLIGLMNGLLVVKFALPSFIVTLGTLEIARGAGYLVTNSQTKYLGEVISSLSTPLPLIGLPSSFLVALVVVAIGQLILSTTVLGRRLIAIGTNEQAVELAGLDPRLDKVLVFGFSGLLCGVGAVLHTSRLGSSDPNAGGGMELAAIAAVVIGGTSLMGGRGSVINSFFGVLIIATIESGLAQIGTSEPLKRVVTGTVIIVAVMIDAWRRRSRQGGAGI